MILISHRGNISGRRPESENHPDYISVALAAGYDVEVDVWFDGVQVCFGHDEPQYDVKVNWVLKDNLWLHAKNLSALHYLILLNCHCFWHQRDAFALTSKGYIWTYPCQEITEQSILIEREGDPQVESTIAAGVCSDNIQKWDDYK